MAVALTFDDGPNSGSTIKLLDLLDKLSIPVTFFVLGEMLAKYPTTLTKAASAAVGHQFGNHSWSHPNFQKLNDEEIKAEIQKTQTLIESTIGKSRTSMLMRPPYGAVTHTQKAMIESLGYKLVFWNVDPEDWKGHKKASEIADYLASHILDGNIVLVHDIHERSVEAMKILLPKLKSQFELVTVEKLQGSTVHSPTVKVHH